MESILFLKEIQKKGNVYKEVWINILMQYEPNGRPIKLIVPYGMPPSTYHKIVTYGVEIFALVSKEFLMVKDKMQLIISIKTEDSQNVQIIAKRNKPRKPKPIIIIEEVFEPTTSITITETQDLLFIEPITDLPQLEPVIKKTIRKKKQLDVLPIHKEIITHLNECAGKKYQFATKSTINLINNKLKEGFTIDDFKHVIEVKCTKWLNTKYQDALTPTTLFGDKFENYLNETLAVINIKQKKAYESVSQATEIGWSSTNN